MGEVVEEGYVAGKNLNYDTGYSWMAKVTGKWIGYCMFS